MGLVERAKAHSFTVGQATITRPAASTTLTTDEITCS